MTIPNPMRSRKTVRKTNVTTRDERVTSGAANHRSVRSSLQARQPNVGCRSRCRLRRRESRTEAFPPARARAVHAVSFDIEVAGIGTCSSNGYLGRVGAPERNLYLGPLVTVAGRHRQLGARSGRWKYESIDLRARCLAESRASGSLIRSGGPSNEKHACDSGNFLQSGAGDRMLVVVPEREQRRGKYRNGRHGRRGRLRGQR